MSEDDSEGPIFDHLEIVRGARNLAAMADGRSRETIRDWVNRGLPHTVDDDKDNTMLFTVGECVAWCADRGLDFFNKSQQLTPVQQQKYRQELHKANELEHKERVRKGEYGSVAEFERLTAAMLQQLRLHMIEIATELKEIGGVKGKQGETMDAKLIEGFNRIAGMPVE